MIVIDILYKIKKQMGVFMETASRQHAGKLSLLFLLFLVYLFDAGSWFSAILPGYQADFVQETAAIFLSIIIEAFPLVLIGVIVSSFLHVFISDGAIHRLLPRSSLAGIVCGSLLGLLFPLCECGIVPIIRRLIQKGVPAYIAVPFMLSAPVINPLVGFSTYLAFTAYPDMLLYRLAGAFISANLIGLLLLSGRKQAVLNRRSAYGGGYECSHTHPQHSGLLTRLRDMLFHTCDEFFDMGRFLIIGSLIAAVIQVTVPRAMLLSVGQEPVLSIAGMMGFAFIISVCSQADAFIAAPFASAFTPGAIAAFLIYGPMLDIKNMIMLFNTFKAEYVIKLFIFITVTVFLISLLINVLPQAAEVLAHA